MLSNRKLCSVDSEERVCIFSISCCFILAKDYKEIELFIEMCCRHIYEMNHASIHPSNALMCKQYFNRYNYNIPYWQLANYNANLDL